MSGALPDPDTFLSGETGHVSGIRSTLARTAGDRVLDLRARLERTGPRLDELAARAPRQEVLALCVQRPGHEEMAAAAARELRESRHDVRLVFGSTTTDGLSGGKFQNLNALLEKAGGPGAGWLLVVDDDVVLPPRFLDRFLGLCEAFGLALAQPAQTLMSHAAWRVTRRRGGSLLRETRLVEIGPVTAFRHDAARALLPFPDLRFGWGLDLHWAALALEHGWRLGIADALPVRHEGAPVATAYQPAEAIEEARRFLAGRPFVTSSEAQRTLAVHRKAPA